MIHAHASQPNYWRHIAPIVDELRARGHDVATWASKGSQPWGARAVQIPAGELVIVASWVDAQRWPRNPLVYVEHGAGQTYRDGAPEGYAGAPGLSHVVSFLAPGEPTADRWRDTYPQADVEAVGCPALDQHFRARARDSEAEATMSHTTVAVTAHWRCGVVPETAPALPEYEGALRELREADHMKDICFVGHAHPRGGRRAQQMWDRLGVPFEVDPDAILRTVGLLVADNTSLMYEAAALDIPVLALNAPRYRRDVEHGLRFWSHVPGLQCDDPAEFRIKIRSALEDAPEARALRARAAAHVYAHVDGRSAARAADAVERAA